MNMCNHYQYKECDCLDGICYSFKQVEEPPLRSSPNKLRAKKRSINGRNRIIRKYHGKHNPQA